MNTGPTTDHTKGNGEENNIVSKQTKTSNLLQESTEFIIETFNLPLKNLLIRWTCICCASFSWNIKRSSNPNKWFYPKSMMLNTKPLHFPISARVRYNSWTSKFVSRFLYFTADGHYIYIETSLPRRRYHKARLVSPTLAPVNPNTTCQVSYYSSVRLFNWRWLLIRN